MADKTNQGVIVWARGKVGQQIGRGECWDLANRALRHARAHSSTTTGKDDDYVWGDPIAVKDAKPGDILQFRDFKITTTVERTVVFDGGSGYRETEEIVARRPHHTGVVDAVPGGGHLVILEQHVKPGGKKVQRHTIAIQGSATPAFTTSKLMKDSGGKRRLAKVIEKVTVVVSGKVWAYRPKAN